MQRTSPTVCRGALGSAEQSIWTESLPLARAALHVSAPLPALSPATFDSAAARMQAKGPEPGLRRVEIAMSARWEPPT